MQRRDKKALLRAGALTLVMVGSLLAGAGPAAAGTFLSVAPVFPVAATVGDTGLHAVITVSNFSTPPETGGTINLSNVTLIPSCGTVAVGDCPGFNADPGVFQVTCS